MQKVEYDNGKRVIVLESCNDFVLVTPTLLLWLDHEDEPEVVPEFCRYVN